MKTNGKPFGTIKVDQVVRVRRDEYECPTPWCKARHSVLVSAVSYNDGDSLGLQIDGDVGMAVCVLDHAGVRRLADGLEKWLVTMSQERGR